jgi:hypothetical protein
MHAYRKLTALAACIPMLLAAPSLAADDATVRRDLTSTIALQGLPCGEVVSVKKQAENDYIASCKDGNHYRIFINAQGRVIVQKQ